MKIKIYIGDEAAVKIGKFPGARVFEVSEAQFGGLSNELATILLQYRSEKTNDSLSVTADTWQAVEDALLKKAQELRAIARENFEADIRDGRFRSDTHFGYRASDFGLEESWLAAKQKHEAALLAEAREYADKWFDNPRFYEARRSFLDALNLSRAPLHAREMIEKDPRTPELYEIFCEKIEREAEARREANALEDAKRKEIDAKILEVVPLAREAIAKKLGVQGLLREFVTAKVLAGIPGSEDDYLCREFEERENPNGAALRKLLEVEKQIAKLKLEEIGVLCKNLGIYRFERDGEKTTGVTFDVFFPLSDLAGDLCFGFIVPTEIC